jgi:hypothetical protein
VETILDLPKLEKMEFKTHPKLKITTQNSHITPPLKPMHVIAETPTMMDSTLSSMKYEKKKKGPCPKY